MKNYTFIFFLLILSSVNCREKGGGTYSKVIVDSTFSCALFESGKFSITFNGGTTTTIVKNEKNGKSDTIGPVPTRDVIRNCTIMDTGRNHYGFDNCLATTNRPNDTLILQFQNNRSDEPIFGWKDKLVYHIYKDEFYAEYVNTDKSPYQLEVTAQMLVLKRLTTARGDDLCGELTLQCVNKSAIKNAPRLITFKGQFHTTIQ
jgi:hypothetical protein